MELKPNEVRSVHFRIRARDCRPSRDPGHGAGSERRRGRRRPPADRGRPRRPSHRAPGFRHVAAARPKSSSTSRRTRFRAACRRSSRSTRSSFSQLVEGLDAIFQRPTAASSRRRRQPIPTSWPSTTSGGRQECSAGRGQGPAVHPPGLPAARQLRDQGRRVRLVRQTPRQPHLDGLRPDGVPGHGEGPRRRPQPDRAHPAMAARPAEARRVVGARRAFVPRWTGRARRAVRLRPA